MKPKARAEGLLVQEVAGETIVYDLERHRAHCLGPLLAALWRSCDGRRTSDQIARRLSRGAGNVDASLVDLSLHRLRRARLVEGAVKPPAGSPRARRELLKRAALLGGLALTSLGAPTAAAAATCIALADCQALGNKFCTNQPCCTPGAPANTFCTKKTSGTFCNCTSP
jgi:hypothetical protein